MSSSAKVVPLKVDFDRTFDNLSGDRMLRSFWNAATNVAG